jgi:hypothetical protein
MRVRGIVTAGLLAIAPLHGGEHHEFRTDEVVIWSEPKAGSLQVGIGHLGDGFVSDRSEAHERFRCDAYESTLWHHGSNATTGAVGWVPACDLDLPD